MASEGLRMGLLSLGSLGLGYLLTTAFTEMVGLEPEAAYGVAVCICSIFNFFGCRHLVFRGTPGPLWQEAAKFFPSVLVFRALEVALFSMLLRIVPNYHVAYFITAVASMACKLLVSKFLIFRRPA